MPHLVEAVEFWLAEPASIVEGIVLEEEADLVT